MIYLHIDISNTLYNKNEIINNLTENYVHIYTDKSISFVKLTQ